MKSINLHDLGMFLDSEVYVIKEEIPSMISKNLLESVTNLVPEVFQEEAIQEELDLIFEGNFEKGILVIYEGSHIELDLRAFLFNILGAVKCSLKDIALSSSESIEEVSQSKIDALAPNKILVFGKLHHPIFQIKQQDYEIKNEAGIEYLFANDLSAIFSNKELKKSLWNKLKLLFEVNN
jgi:hypothetical protein